MKKKNGTTKMKAHVRGKAMDILDVTGLESPKEQEFRMRKLPNGAVGTSRLTFDQTFGIRPAKA